MCRGSAKVAQGEAPRLYREGTGKVQGRYREGTGKVQGRYREGGPRRGSSPEVVDERLQAEVRDELLVLTLDGHLRAQERRR